MRHTWSKISATGTIVEELCSRCELRRWRAPLSLVWFYGDGLDGRWTALDEEPEPCWPTLGEAA
jgi:hypothetical protein